MKELHQFSRVNQPNIGLSFWKALLLAAAMVITSLTMFGARQPELTHDEAGPIVPLSEKDWGVRPIGIRLTASNYMLDFRYRVLDAEKAAAIINRKTKPYLIVEKTGVRLNVPTSYKVGPLRQSAQFAQPNKNYFMIFVNPGRLVKAGEKVTIVAGDFKLEHLTVQ